ncbi:FAD-dependent monooxygenase [Streptomyces aureus]|uniref:FAD-dependent monooxygenase n=1 Tax=Streptomyces aureus TaxID=193461 RepID=UPI0036C293AF
MGVGVSEGLGGSAGGGAGPGAGAGAGPGGGVGGAVAGAGGAESVAGFGGVGGGPGSVESSGLAASVPSVPSVAGVAGVSGSVLVGGVFHFAGIPGLEISVPAAEPLPVLKCSQEVLERHFEGRARAAGARVLRGFRVERVRQGSGGVSVVARGPGGLVVCRGGFVVGADGARSVVRRQVGFGVRSWPATVSAMAGDVRVVGGGVLEEGWHRTERGWVLVRHVEGGMVRLRTLNCRGASPRHGEPLLLEELEREVGWITGRDVVMGEGRWLSRFSDFSRLASSFRMGRVLLAGDAAHVHFPIGGQGLSTGLLDAVNLGWKLALAVRGRAGAGLLDTYDQERRPAAQRVIDNTRAQLALMRPGPELEPLRALFGELLAQRGESGVLASMVSGQDTVLPGRGAKGSAWEGTFLHNAVLQTREGTVDVIGLLRQGSPLLLLFGDRGSGGGYAEQARGWAGLVRVVHAEPVPGLACDALLVRPDGYIAWASGSGGPAAALTEYFGQGVTATRERGVLAGVVS